LADLPPNLVHHDEPAQNRDHLIRCTKAGGYERFVKKVIEGRFVFSV
jgi:hypothetical protein